MNFTQDNDYTAVLDACVLAPMSLCDCLLRLAEEPALYHPLWSEEILAELGRTLGSKLGRSAKEVNWRLTKMRESFPEAMVEVPPDLHKAIECIPDRNDRHVLAAALVGKADVIVTQNKKHFPDECLKRFGLSSQNADEFLVDQFHLAPEVVRDKLDDQAAGIGQSREYVVAMLERCAPGFIALVRREG